MGLTKEKKAEILLKVIEKYEELTKGMSDEEEQEIGELIAEVFFSSSMFIDHNAEKRMRDNIRDKYRHMNKKCFLTF